jgi:hypothetical protein
MCGPASIRKRDINFQAPWPEFRGVRNFADIVILYTAAQILSQACVEAVRFEVASKNVNVSEVCHTLACRVVARGVGMRNFERGPPSPRLRRESSLSTYDASEDWR